MTDPDWLPEVGRTAPDPSYPGAHAVLSAAGAKVLISFFERDHSEFNVSSEVLPGVERAFMGFSAAAEEATLSRVFAGQHFRFELTAGLIGFFGEREDKVEESITLAREKP